MKNRTYEDIIEQVPEACGDKSCPAQYHMAYYWIYGTGGRSRFSVCDGDGNHEDISRRDVPTPERAAAAWREYYEYVARTGSDPCGEFRPPDVYRNRAHKWQARISRWLGESLFGLKVLGVRRRGRGPWRALNDAPRAVSEFLGARPRSGDSWEKIQARDVQARAAAQWVMPDFKNPAALLALLNSAGSNVEKSRQRGGSIYVTFDVIEPPAPISDKALRAYLKKRAREQLKAMGPQ